jgi:NAD(P)-dependent dehydrogenase (short-subunit alcohol dehydrogenase family)
MRPRKKQEAAYRARGICWAVNERRTRWDKTTRMGRFDGKTALITGAASGIGRAMALRFGMEGARLVVVDLAEGVRDTAAEIEGAGGRAHAVTGDASSPELIDEAVSIAESLGGLDIACANAGISGGMQTLAELQVGDWERVLHVNLIGPFVLVQRAAAAMVPRGRGSIVCTASVAGLRSGAGGMPYSASKAGVISLVQTAANQLAGSGVRVNAICPGLTETGMTKPMFDAARERGSERKLGQLNPLKRAAAPDEAAALALFLASDDASYVNGQAIAVDGGLSSSHPVVPGRMA